MVSAGWALELRGEQIDLDDVRQGLKPPFDPWVEDCRDGENEILLLRSHSWENAETTAEMMADAVRLIKHINGALLLEYPDAALISHGVTFRFDEDGLPLPVTIRGALNITLPALRARGRAVVESKTPKPEPTPSPMQMRLQKADELTVVSDLMTFLVRAENRVEIDTDTWFDVFKAIESVEALVGGEANAIKLAKDWKRAKQTANRYRHAPSPKHQLPKNPPSVDEAKSIVVAVARDVVDGVTAIGTPYQTMVAVSFRHDDISR